MKRTRCTHFTPETGQCRCRARVRMLVVTVHRISRTYQKYYELTVCWPHYLEMERRARKGSSTIEIIYAVEIITAKVDGIEHEITLKPEGELEVHNTSTDQTQDFKPDDTGREPWEQFLT